MNRSYVFVTEPQNDTKFLLKAYDSPKRVSLTRGRGVLVKFERAIPTDLHGEFVLMHEAAKFCAETLKVRVYFIFKGVELHTDMRDAWTYFTENTARLAG